MKVEPLHGAVMHCKRSVTTWHHVAMGACSSVTHCGLQQGLILLRQCLAAASIPVVHGLSLSADWYVHDTNEKQVARQALPRASR